MIGFFIRGETVISIEDFLVFRSVFSISFSNWAWPLELPLKFNVCCADQILMLSNVPLIPEAKSTCFAALTYVP